MAELLISPGQAKSDEGNTENEEPLLLLVIGQQNKRLQKSIQLA